MNVIPFTLWLEFEHWLPKLDDNPEDDFCNIRVDLASDEAYTLNVWTFKYLEGAHREDERTGESLSGRYLIGPDLLVTRLERAILEEVVTDLLRTGRLKQEWRIPLDIETSPA